MGYDKAQMIVEKVEASIAAFKQNYNKQASSHY